MPYQVRKKFTVLTLLGSIVVHFKRRNISYFVNQMHQNSLSWRKVTQDMKKGSWEGLKVTKSFDIPLSDGHIFMQQTPPPKTKGRLCSLANQFPTPTHSSHFTRALIQPLLLPLASADWLTYGSAPFCFSSSAWSPENQILTLVNLFWFLFGKERTASSLYILLL